MITTEQGISENFKKLSPNVCNLKTRRTKGA